MARLGGCDHVYIESVQTRACADACAARLLTVERDSASREKVNDIEMKENVLLAELIHHIGNTRMYSTMKILYYSYTSAVYDDGTRAQKLITR